MENKKLNTEEEEINNPEQFQIGRNHIEEDEESNDDSTYTEQENEFADGKGSDLAEAFDDENLDDADLDEEEKQED